MVEIMLQKNRADGWLVVPICLGIKRVWGAFYSLSPLFFACNIPVRYVKLRKMGNLEEFIVK